MDYESEQAMELEALEAIFPDSLEEYDGNLPDGWTRHGKTYSIDILPSAEVGAADDEDEEPELQMQLVFAHTPTYPDEPPCIRLRSVKGLSDADLQEATAELQQLIQESLGMSMVYTLVTAAQEWLAARVAAGPSSSGLDPEAEEKRRREEEEAARTAARAHGTPVTIEAFDAWRKKFEAEQALQKAQLADTIKADARAGRITGKQWFMQQIAAGQDVSGSEEGEMDAEDEDGVETTDYQNDESSDDIDYEDDDDEGLLDEYLEAKN